MKFVLVAREQCMAVMIVEWLRCCIFNINCDIGHHSVDSKSHVESATMAILLLLICPTESYKVICSMHETITY